jgi:hypothetical protein
MVHVAEQARLIAGVDVDDDVTCDSPSAVFRRLGMGLMVCRVVDVISRTRCGGTWFDGLADGAGARAAGRAGSETTVAGSTADMEPQSIGQTEAAYGIRMMGDPLQQTTVRRSWKRRKNARLC